MFLTEEQLADALVSDFPLFCEAFIKIIDKRGNVVPFKLNKHQMTLWQAIKEDMKNDAPIRIIILKCRQLGFSTMMQAFLFWRALTKPGSGGLVIAHKDDASSELFGKIELMYRELPEAFYNELNAIKDTSKKGKKLAWAGKLNTKLYVDTAGNLTVGRSQTYQGCHLSEVAFYDYPEEIMYGMLQSLPKDSFSIAVVESTANGAGTYFHVLWERSQTPGSSWKGLFFSWKDEPSYKMKPPSDFKLTPAERKIKTKWKLTDDQIYWRRVVIDDECNGDEDKFRQEYPIEPKEAFIVSGSLYFGPKNVEAYLDKVAPPKRMGRIAVVNRKPMFIDEQPDSQYDPPWWIWDSPERHCAYAIGADVAGGTARDYSAAHIINLTKRSIVATFRGKLDPDEFARELRVMGLTYNTALIAPEVNGEGRATLLKLVKDLKYPRVFYHQYDEEWSGGLQHRYGWRTTVKTRPTMLGQALESLRKRSITLRCERTIGELGAFIRTSTNKLAEAGPGAYDDMVMSFCIANSSEVAQIGQLYVDSGIRLEMI